MKDQSGKQIHRNIRQERDGTWGVNVWFGQNPPTNIRRAYYETRAQARNGDISHAPGQSGCVGFGEYQV